MTQNTAAPPLRYFPLYLILGFIAGGSLLSQYPWALWDNELFMRHIMAGFFVVFAFFKLLNMQGFQQSYIQYDWVAQRIAAWGWIYPFVELSLGIAYWIDLLPVWRNSVTCVLMALGSAGILDSIVRKKRLQCACLGTMLNVPLGVVSLVEDLSMLVMAGLLLIM